MNKTEVLDTAKNLLTDDRQKDYGDAVENHDRIARMWSEVLKTEVAGWQVAACMAMVKVSRLIQTPAHSDSWVDLAAYAAIGGECATDEEEDVRRSWNRLSDIPSGVDFTDMHGTVYRWVEVERFWEFGDGNVGGVVVPGDESFDLYGPFTELVEQ